MKGLNKRSNLKLFRNLLYHTTASIYRFDACLYFLFKLSLDLEFEMILSNFTCFIVSPNPELIRGFWFKLFDRESS